MPNGKDSYYFSHDANARNDERILMLRAEHGWEGYGIYWLLIEMMFENKDTCLKHSRIKGIAKGYNVDITVLESVINTAITEGLFQSDGESFWSESLRRRKKEFKELREKRSNAGKKGMRNRWNKADEKHSYNSVITKDNKGKERKVNKSKENKRKENISDEFEIEDFSSEPQECFDIRKLFNSHCKSLPKVVPVFEWSDDRKTTVQLRWKEHPDFQFWIDLFDKIENSDFLTGKISNANSPPFVATFDWIMKKSNLTKIIEGNFENRAGGDEQAIIEKMRRLAGGG